MKAPETDERERQRERVGERGVEGKPWRPRGRELTAQEDDVPSDDDAADDGIDETLVPGRDRQASHQHFIRQGVQVRAQRALLGLHPLGEVAVEPVAESRDEGPPDGDRPGLGDDAIPEHWSGERARQRDQVRDCAGFLVGPSRRFVVVPSRGGPEGLRVPRPSYPIFVPKLRRAPVKVPSSVPTAGGPPAAARGRSIDAGSAANVESGKRQRLAVGKGAADPHQPPASRPGLQASPQHPSLSLSEEWLLDGC